MTRPTVGSVLYAFFQDHMKAQKGLSNASVKSYRDGLRHSWILSRGTRSESLQN